MTKRLALPERHQAFNEVSNYKNTLTIAFRFLDSEQIDYRGGAEFEKCRETVLKARDKAIAAAELYVDQLKNNDSDDFVTRLYTEFRCRTDEAITQMDMLGQTTQSVERSDDAVTVKLPYADRFTYWGMDTADSTHDTHSADVKVHKNVADVMKGVSDLREGVWQRQLAADFRRLNDSIGNQYKPRNAEMGYGV